MRKVKKQAEPDSLAQFKRRHPNARNDALERLERHDVRQDIRQACLTEQFYLCAYCCQRITDDSNDCMNEHIEAQKSAPNRTLDYANTVSSCTTKNQCDQAHGAQYLPLTPLMDECETELKFKISGRVEGLTPEAQETIKVLNLGDSEQNNRGLIERRKQLANSLLFQNGIDPNEGLEDEELIAMVIADLEQPEAGKLEPFAPVAVNILQGWLSSNAN